MKTVTKILIIGARGFIGSRVASATLRAGHSVTGTASLQASAALLAAEGISPLIVDLEAEPDSLLEALPEFDVMVFAPQLDLVSENTLVSRVIERIERTGKTFIFTSGTGVLAKRTFGHWSAETYSENDPFAPEKILSLRLNTEARVRSSAARGVRGMVIRPPMVWGPGEHANTAMIYQSVARTGSACYVGPGLNCYSHVHVDDLADLYCKAIEFGKAGALYHAVAGEVPNRWIAEAVARDLGCSTRSLDVTEAFDIWDKFITLVVMGANSRSTSPLATSELGWAPHHRDLFEQIGDEALRRLATVKDIATVAPGRKSRR